MPRLTFKLRGQFAGKIEQRGLGADDLAEKPGFHFAFGQELPTFALKVKQVLLGLAQQLHGLAIAPEYGFRGVAFLQGVGPALESHDFGLTQADQGRIKTGLQVHFSEVHGPRVGNSVGPGFRNGQGRVGDPPMVARVLQHAVQGEFSGVIASDQSFVRMTVDRGPRAVPTTCAEPLEDPVHVGERRSTGRVFWHIYLELLDFHYRFISVSTRLMAKWWAHGNPWVRAAGKDP